jgi:hypothetical protein
MMTEKEAWLFIAERWDKEQDLHENLFLAGGNQVTQGNFTSNGLCLSVIYMEDTLIDFDTYSNMRRRIDDYLVLMGCVHGYAFPQGNGLYRKERAALARKFAEECEL